MKNNNQNDIRQGRANKSHKTMPTDVLVVPEVAQQNYEKLAQRPRRKRRTNYAKKIMNDEFLFNV